MGREPDQQPLGEPTGHPLDAPFREVVQHTGASIVLLYQLDTPAGKLRLVMASGTSREMAAPWARVSEDRSGPVTDAIRDRHLVWVGEQEELARRYPRLGIVLPYAFRLAAAPVTDTSGVRGAAVLLWPTVHPPHLTTRERVAIRVFCQRAGAVLRRTAGSAGEVPTADDPRFLPAIRPREPDPLQARAAHEFADRLPMGCCSLDMDGRITYINPSGAELVGADVDSLQSQRPWEALPWLRDPMFEESYRAAVVSRRPTSFTALRPPDTRLRFQLFPDSSGISVQFAPVANGTATAPGYRAQADPVGAIPLHHLTHVASALAEGVGVHDVAERIADQLVPGLGPQGLVLLTVADGRLLVVSHRGDHADFIKQTHGVTLTSDVPVVRTLASGEPGFYSSPVAYRRAHPDADDFSAEEGARVLLPLIASGGPIGSLVLSYSQSRAFPPTERAMLTSLAGLIAQTLARARLYDAQYTLTHSLQAGLLPRSLPTFNGLETAACYRPASHGIDIGGDFYDLIAASTPSAALAVIGDVEGHNAQAATLMGQVRTAVHAYAAVSASPGAVLARTNRLLLDLDPGLLASCLIAQVDTDQQWARIATAGHPRPVLRDPDGHTKILDLTPGPLLGVAANPGYPSTEIQLPPGAVLLLYTDGLVEAPGTSIDDAVRDLADRLAQMSGSLQHTADSLAEQAYRRTSHADDIALLLIRLTDD
ncbi:SpoIIE family protein phosphatase [Streptomyces sp. NPDC051940]|uniref:SpoIIE family protein phosphatase n=1 Tax=Streptomyces sp. NPDC051940 TaxID=3155675 RepID=UPI00344947C8